METNILKQNILSINGSEYNGAYLYNKQQATFEALWYKNNTFFAFMIFFPKLKLSYLHIFYAFFQVNVVLSIMFWNIFFIKIIIYFIGGKCYFPC